MKRPLLLCLSLTLAFGAACNRGTPDTTAEALASTVHRTQVEHLIRTLSLAVPERAAHVAREAASPLNLEELLALDDAGLELPPERVETLRAIYAARDHRSAFFYGNQPTRQGAATLEVLRNAVEVHALRPDEFTMEELETRLRRLEEDLRVEPLLHALSPASEDEERLLAWVLGETALDQTVPAQDAILTHILSDATDNPLPWLPEAIEELRVAWETVGQSGPELELLTASAALDLAIALRLGNLHYVSRDRARERGWDVNSEDQRPAILHTLALEWFADAFEHGVAEALVAVAPPFDQYRRLVAGLARYREMVAAGGWQPLSSTGVLRAGSEGAGVRELRERLAAEHYLPPSTNHSTRWTPELSRALTAYQSTHQLRETGSVTEETRRSLDIPATRRAAQIALSLERWRESRVGADHERDYIHVNLPDFHAELWERDERIHRWKVVIGSTRRVRNRQTGELALGDATPLFSRGMRFIVFNPYWNVPPGIRARDYADKEDDPEWLEENGFEVIVNERGERFLRQLPGPDNALGAVKFLFPNSFHVYMHDTPRRDLFDHELRAYSAGCIRVEDPMFLAHLLIMRDRRWSEARTWEYIEEQIEKEGEQWFTLRDPVPVHIEYYVVRGDAEGRMHFLADIYRHDRERLDEVEERLFGNTSEEETVQTSHVGHVDGP